MGGDDWQQIRDDVCGAQETSDPGDDASKGVVQRKEEDDDAGEEKEEGDVEDRREESDNESYTPFLEAVVTKLADERTVSRGTRNEGGVLSQPLFGNDCKECGGETEGETNEPKAVDPYITSGHGERCVGGWNGGKGGSVFLCALERYHLTEKGIGYVCFVWGEGLGCLHDKRRQNRSKKTSLECLISEFSEIRQSQPSQRREGCPGYRRLR